MRPFATHLVPPVNLPPDTPMDIFSKTDLDLEIGAGQGLHAIRYCLENPSRHLLAVERTHQRFQRLTSRQQSHPQIKNLVALHADAISVITHLVHDHSLDRVFLLYPNPYPKAKQANLRWHNMPFMATLQKKLKPEGQLILATNIQSYADQARQQLTEAWQFELRSDCVLDPRSQPRTHFEKKYLSRGESCWNLVFSKATL